MTDFRVPQLLMIGNGTTLSNVLDLVENRSKVPVGLTITSPTTLPEVVTVQAATSLTNPNWQNLQTGGADIVLAAGKTTQITELTAWAIRLIAGGAVAADRAFNIVGNARA